MLKNKERLFAFFCSGPVVFKATNMISAKFTNTVFCSFIIRCCCDYSTTLFICLPLHITTQYHFLAESETRALFLSRAIALSPSVHSPRIDGNTRVVPLLLVSAVASESCLCFCHYTICLCLLHSSRIDRNPLHHSFCSFN